MMDANAIFGFSEKIERIFGNPEREN